MLTTDRLTLRRFCIDDVEAMHHVLSDPRAMRYWSTLPHSSLDQTRAWVSATATADPSRSDDFAILRDGVVIGKAGLWEIPEIGILLHPDHWGQGLAREALVAVLGDIFARRPGLAEVTADVDPRNGASLRLLQGLGFRVTGMAKGTFVLGDEVCDSTYLTLNREDWRLPYQAP